MEQDTQSAPHGAADLKRLSTPIAIVIAGIVIALAIMYVGKNGTPSLARELPTNALRADARPVDETDHVFGSRDADVMLIEYSDFECPFCSKIHPRLAEIVENSNGKVAWTYRHFPLTSIHTQALPTAIASECVAKLKGNDAFWAFAAATFSAPGLEDGVSLSFAKALGIPEVQLRACIADPAHETRVRAEFDEAIALGAQGTPFVVVLHANGNKTSFSGALPKEYIEQIIAGVGKR